VSRALRAQKQAPARTPAATQTAAEPERTNADASSVTIRETVKVDANRLDQLVDMIGELVIAESMVCQSNEFLATLSTDLNRHVSQLDKITRELQEMAMGLRMVPIRSTFQKMARLVRDLSRKTGKEVQFTMQGEDTELDKTVVDRISDPLVHMVRNSVDHGLEPDSAARRAAGKPPVGTVSLRAYHSGGNIQIEIFDDGRGLDREAILNKARERDLIQDNGEGMSDKEVWQLIFEPGFSTAKQLTEVSGRGVGMDVVKRNIEALRGEIDIQSEPGAGSRFTIQLPLTLAIIDGMVVRVSGERYIIPTLSIVVSVRPTTDDIFTVVGRAETMRLQGEIIPLLRLHELFELPGAIESPEEGTVVVLENGGKRVGLLIDEILGQQQIVIKSLGESLKGTKGIAGGAIMPDGKVGLILDIPSLVRLASEAVPA
jgi:two-component system chemotaxis sensor kinase CheA